MREGKGEGIRRREGDEKEKKVWVAGRCIVCECNWRL